MEGSPYQKSSISWKGGRSLGLVPWFLLAGTWSVPLSGTRGPGSCPKAGGNDTEERVGRIFRMHGASHQIIPNLRKMNFDLPSLPASLVGGRVRPRRLFAYPFSSPATSHGEVPEADNEVILMAPLKQRCSYVLDDGPCSEIQEEDLIAIQRKYAIHSSVQMRSPSAFERTADRGPNEMAVFEAYLVAGFRGIIPSLVAEISSFFGFCPSQLTPLSLRTLISIQVLGNSMKLQLKAFLILAQKISACPTSARKQDNLRQLATRSARWTARGQLATRSARWTVRVPDLSNLTARDNISSRSDQFQLAFHLFGGPFNPT
uniref:Uncharacterized protein n=1 Tax=Brassica oleracea var. oleracea TaxID=109376 RepID=A0A0D3DS05_BRAOL